MTADVNLRKCFTRYVVVNTLDVKDPKETKQEQEIA